MTARQASTRHCSAAAVVSLMLPTVKRALALATVFCCLALGLFLSHFWSSEPLDFQSDREREENVTVLRSVLTRDGRCNGSAADGLLDEYTSTPELTLILSLLDAYRLRHKSWRVALLGGDNTIRTLTWMCYTSCGGIGDRVKGIATSLLLASLTDRLFLIKWSTPFDPRQQRLLFQPAAIDWDINQYKWNLVGHHAHVHVMTTADMKWAIQVLQGTIFNNSIHHVTVRTNIHYRNFFLGLPNFDTSTLHILNKKGLTYQVLKQLQGRNELISGVLVRFLFRFSAILLPGIVNMTKALGLEHHPYVGVHLRTGFFGTLNENPERFGEFHHKKMWKQLLDCAIEKGEALLGSGSAIVLLTDSTVVKEWATNQYNGRVMVTPKEIIHIDKEEDSDHSNDAALQAGAELGILAYSSLLFVSSSSGFSHVAREYCGIPESRLFNGLSCK